jgi:hypothetical protein
MAATARHRHCDERRRRKRSDARFHAAVGGNGSQPLPATARHRHCDERQRRSNPQNGAPGLRGPQARWQSTSEDAWIARNPSEAAIHEQRAWITRSAGEAAIHKRSAWRRGRRRVPAVTRPQRLARGPAASSSARRPRRWGIARSRRGRGPLGSAGTAVAARCDSEQNTEPVTHVFGLDRHQCPRLPAATEQVASSSWPASRLGRTGRR